MKYSMPLWRVELWTESYGADRTEKILEGLLAIHPVSLRFRSTMSETENKDRVEQMEKAGARLKKSTLLPYLYTVENTEQIAGLPGYTEGKFVVQDASSALAVEAAGIKKTDFVLVICAAPGGKSMLAAEKAGEVFSRDVSENKVCLIEENIARMGFDNIKVEVHDATIADEKLKEKVDVVLADVPCSGLGVMGKKRDIKYHISPEKLVSIAELQKEIITSSWSYVKPGGVLLYSTCTINPLENEKMSAWIVEKFPFELEEERQFIPGEDETDGFYYARLRRK